MPISTPRLILRELTVADVTPTYVGWLNDPEVFRYLETRLSVQDEPAVRGFVEAVAARDNEFLYGIFLRDGGRHIGNIKVGPIRAYHHVADVSLFIGERDCWGRGFASEAIVAVSRHAFDVLGVKKLSAGMYAPNQGSYRAFLKAGYSEEGRRRRHLLLDGEAVDLIEVGALPGDVK